MKMHNFADNFFLAWFDGNDKNKPRIWNICKNESNIRLWISKNVMLVWRLSPLSFLESRFSLVIASLFDFWLRIRTVLVIMWCTRIANSINGTTHTYKFKRQTWVPYCIVRTEFSINRQCNLRKSLDDILSSTFITAVSTWYIVCLFVCLFVSFREFVFSECECVVCELGMNAIECFEWMCICVCV